MKLYSHLLVGTLLCSASLLAVACGGDDDSDDGSGGSSGSTSSSGGASGKGGSSTSSGGKSTTGGSSSTGCDPTADLTGSGDDSCPGYTECTEAQCDAESQRLPRRDYASGNFSGGACEDLMNCVKDCDCDSSCTQGCFGQASSECTQCFLDLTSCTNGNCGEPQACEGSSGTNGMGSGGTTSAGTAKTCADLEACCVSASGEQQTQCQQTYDAVKDAGDAVCDATYRIFKASGICQ